MVEISDMVNKVSHVSTNNVQRLESDTTSCRLQSQFVAVQFCSSTTTHWYRNGEVVPPSSNMQSHVSSPHRMAPSISSHWVHFTDSLHFHLNILLYMLSAESCYSEAPLLQSQLHGYPIRRNHRLNQRRSSRFLEQGRVWNFIARRGQRR